MIFRQLFESSSSTYTYLCADERSKEAILVDPVFETVERDWKLVGELGVKLKYLFDTHVHADHISGSASLRELSGAQIVGAEGAGVEGLDQELKDGDCLSLGNMVMKFISTPGHTAHCMCLYLNGKVFTGDTLFIRGTGRTDFQQGSSKQLFHSVQGKLFALPSETEVFPGHDYKGMTVSTIEEEMKFNPRVFMGQTAEAYAEIMANLNLDPPKKIKESVPANLHCGKLKSA